MCSRISGSPVGPRRQGRAASTSIAGSSHAGPFPRSVGRRWRWRARSSAAPPRSPPAAGGRKNGTACSSITTRTPRTGPSPPPTRSAPRPTPACPRPYAGTRCPPARRRPLRSPPSRGALPRLAIPRKASTRRSGRSRHCSSSRRGTRRPASETRRGRRTSPSRRASRLASSCPDAGGRIARPHPRVRFRRPPPARPWVLPVAAAPPCP